MLAVPQFGGMAISLGIHLRVGIEDKIWRRKGERMTSVQQIEQMVQFVKELGHEVATGDDARRILKFGTWYNSPNERLTNLGLPLNREGGQIGFFDKETDGKLKPHAVSTTVGLPMAGTHSTAEGRIHRRAGACFRYGAGPCGFGSQPWEK